MLDIFQYLNLFTVGSMYAVTSFFDNSIILCSGWRATSDCLSLPKGGRSWSKISPLAGGARHAAASIVFKKTLLIIGGCSNTDSSLVLNSVIELKNRTGKWTPTGCFHKVATWIF